MTKIVTSTDIGTGLSIKNDKLVASMNTPPKLFTLVGANGNDITPDNRAFMRRLFVNPITGQGFLRLMFTANVANSEDAYIMDGMPKSYIRASDLVDDGNGEVYLLAGNTAGTGQKIGFRGLTVGKTYHIMLHGFWDLSEV